MAIKITEKDLATQVGTHLNLLVVQDESGVQSLRRMSEAVYEWSGIPHDLRTAVVQILERIRQHGWDLDAALAYLKKVNKVYSGTVTLTNNQEFPINSSQVTISIGETLDNALYDVDVKVTASTGNIGDLIVSDKLTNGFKLAFDGSGTSATVVWTLIPQVANADF